MAQAYFTQIEGVISEHISQARESIQISVAWFTNKGLYSHLLGKLREGVRIELIVRDDYVNNSDAKSSLNWGEFYGLGGKLYFPPSPQILHHKYCLIDSRVVISGSYNWTYQAEFVNQENVLLTDETGVAEAFISNFNGLKESSRLVQSLSHLNYRSHFDAPSELLGFAEQEWSTAEVITGLETLLTQAEAHYLNKRYDDAILLAQKSLTSADHNPFAFEIQAMAKIRQGKFNEAKQVAEEGLKAASDSPDLHNALGLAYLGLEDHPNAINSFDKAIKLLPDSTNLIRNKIGALYRAGKHQLFEKEKLELHKVASAIIRKPHDHPSSFVLYALINMASFRNSRDEQVKYATKAKNLFLSLPEKERDLHDLDDINSILRG